LLNKRRGRRKKGKGVMASDLEGQTSHWKVKKKDQLQWKTEREDSLGRSVDGKVPISDEVSTTTIGLEEGRKRIQELRIEKGEKINMIPQRFLRKKTCYWEGGGVKRAKEPEGRRGKRKDEKRW